MRIAVFGTGGAGGYFGSLLAKAGEEVILSPVVTICGQFGKMVWWSRQPTVKSGLRQREPRIAPATPVLPIWFWSGSKHGK